MALWGKKDEELPESLRGKTPEQIAELLRLANEKDTQLQQATSDKTAAEQRATEAQRIADERQQQLDAMQPPPPEPKNDEPATIWTDPQKWVQEQTKETQAVALLSGITSAKMYAMQQLAGRDQKIWRKYEKEIDKVMEGYNPMQRCLPNNWLMALTLIKGQHDVEIAKAESTSTDFFSEQSSRGTPPPDDRPADKLSPEEEEVCKVMHWDTKRYLETKKKQVIHQSEKGAYARFGV